MKRNSSKVLVAIAIGVLSMAIFVINDDNNDDNTSNNNSHINQNSEQPFSFKFNSENMPIVKEANPAYANIRNSRPSPNRTQECRKWLQSSFQISVRGGSGSGTLVYYDKKQKTGYVISCGHFWEGFLDKGQCNLTVNVIVFYHNNKKLSQPRTYPGKVVFYSNQNGVDISLIKFQLDWTPQIYYPIARLRQLKRGERLHSVGCDHGTEVADYFVEVIGYGGDPRGGSSITTQYNSPRPGRSGGGLMDQSGYFVGICWGTSSRDGTGTGYFVPLQVIHRALTDQGYNFLLNKTLPTSVYNIPIVDANDPNKKYPKGLLLIPNR